jgi:aurora kinase
VLLGAGGALKLADFGLAIDTHQERPVTRAGTLDYMAPEVRRKHKNTAAAL